MPGTSQRQRPPSPWPTTVTRNRPDETGPLIPQPRHGRPDPQPAPAYRNGPAPARDSVGMRALRVTTYLLVSLASLLFIAIVVYGVIEAVQLRDSLAGTPFGGLVGSSQPEATSAN